MRLATRKIDELIVIARLLCIYMYNMPRALKYVMLHGMIFKGKFQYTIVAMTKLL